VDILNQSVIKGTFYAIDIELEDRFPVGDLEITPRVAGMAKSLLDIAKVRGILRAVSCLACDEGSLYSRWRPTSKLRFLYDLTVKPDELQIASQGNELEPGTV